MQQTPKMIQTEVLRELETPNQCFSDLTINYFIKMVQATTDFEMFDAVFFYFPELYRECDKERDDVQILYGGGIGESVIGHWICIFYKAENRKVHVLDSLNRNILHERQIEIIQHRYPQKEEIVFMKPRILQSDRTSCGPLAIAYATTIILGEDPITYEFEMDGNGVDNSSFLRKHIRRMFESNELLHFPRVDRSDL